ncbi:GDSL-type esterase/lipase family protein [Flavisolibacter tropicus]|uniref:GDSL family lipase n=1 Tax=Flavisolibacter tropicus TaxID=1492898 RepID=A0A172TSL7_9BACT|nr:GDSL-type esterase/lipase family protein [Flavisolibacter tropicus]ANE49986.1 GDSL family lipase [Flavisolibacter tropicus]
MRIIYLAILLLFVGTLAAQESIAIDSSYINSHYQHRVQLFRSLPKQKNAIVFLGNSITEAGEWQELIPGKPVCNRGISGDVTYGVLARLGDVLAIKPAKLFLLIGINDLKRGIPVDTIACTYERIVARIRKECPTTRLYLQSVLPVNETLLPASYQRISSAKVATLNARIKALAAAYSVAYVNLHEVFATEQGQLPKGVTIDGIHLWPDAYVSWVKYLTEKGYL